MTDVLEAIEKIDHLLNREEHDSGYAAFVHIRRIWPQLKAAVASPSPVKVDGAEIERETIERCAKFLEVVAQSYWEFASDAIVYSNAHVGNIIGTQATRLRALSTIPAPEPAEK